MNKKKSKADRLRWKEKSSNEKNPFKNLKDVLDESIVKADIPSKPEHGEFLIP